MLQGNVFSFLVGPNKVAFKVHSELLQKYSLPLHALVSNGMKESQGVAWLQEDDPHVSGLFLEWAYTSRYRATQLKSDSTDHIQRSPGNLTHRRCNGCDMNSAEARLDKVFWQSAKEDCGEVWFTPSICDENECRVDLEGCQEMRYLCGKCEKAHFDFHHLGGAHGKEGGEAGGVGGVPDICRELRRSIFSPPPAQESPELSHKSACIVPSGDLMTAAKAYVFANKYLVNALEKESLTQLQEEVKVYNVKEKGSMRLVSLLRFAYNNGSGNETDTNVDDLEEIVQEYAAIGTRELLDCKDFRGLVEEGGKTSLHLMDVMVKRHI
jgi:hypothetical protein